jgi:hypothetical protein
MSDNVKIAFDYVEKYEGTVWILDKDGSRWVFAGIMLCRDDMYYEMINISNIERQLLSFVGIPESFGFEMEKDSLQE